MGDSKHLQSSEAISKINELAKEINTCMFGTYENNKFFTRPMSTQQIDDEGNLWFLSDKSSRKNDHITMDSRVELIYSHGNDKFLSIHGNAAIAYDKEKIKELWQPMAKIWFTDGVDDPRISIIKVSFTDGYYWNTKHGRMVEIAIMAAAFISGKTMDDGIEGKLEK